MDYSPQRIICMTEETTETLYLLGEQDRIVGISGYTVRPPQARKEKPKVSAFTSANLDKILALEPDLVLGFSDMQADIAADLVRQGIAVHIFNQRTVDGILKMMVTLGSLVGAAERARAWVEGFQEKRAQLVRAGTESTRRPRVYFEEWDEPMITGIGWVSELIELAGGVDCYAHRAQESLAKNRIIENPSDVIAQAPDIIIGSWCGKKFRPERVVERPGWDAIQAVRQGEIHEIKSPLILQPGPAALTDGLDTLREIVTLWQEKQST